MNSYLYIEKSSDSTGKHFRADLKYDFFYYLLWVSKFLTTLIFPKNQRQCASFLINVAILFLSIRSSGAPPCPIN